MVAMMSRGLVVVALLCLAAAPVKAQDDFLRAKELYASASYEEALSLLDGLQQRTVGFVAPDVQQYRAFCLLALQRNDEAKQAIEQLFTADPMFRLDETATSPRVQTTFREIRRNVLPSLAQRSYTTAKAAFDKKDPKAAAAFDRVLALLDDPDMEGQALPDFRTVVAAFRDLSATIAAPPPPARAATPAAPSAPPAATPAAASVAPAATPTAASTPPAAATPPATTPPAAATAPPATTSAAGGATASGTATAAPAAARTAPAPASSVVVPAVSISRPMPPWVPRTSADAREIFEGEVEVAIDAQGNVTSASLSTPIYPVYDQQLLAYAKRWKFSPAMRNGQPIASIQLVPIRLQAGQPRE